MRILGIHDSHDCGAALIKDGAIIAAINEERLNRMKMCWGFPKKSIKTLLEMADLKPKDIDLIAIASERGLWQPNPLSHKEASQKMDLLGTKKTASKASTVAGNLMKKEGFIPVQKAIEMQLGGKERQKKIKEWTKEKGFDCEILFVDHHMAHAASAYFTSGKERATIVTSDAAGDALSSLICSGEKGEITIRHKIGSYNSIGKYYAYVTELCGFTPNKHEGKITGLAAYGKPAHLDYFNRQITFEKGSIVNHSNARHSSAVEKIRRELRNFSKEDLAASVQNHLEQNMVKYISHWVEKTELPDVVTAGGVFANVKLNQRIIESKPVESFFTHPHMGDGGLAVGAALYAYSQKLLDQGSFLKPFSLDNVYFGPGYTNDEVQKALEKEGLKAREVSDVEAEAARLVAKKKVVGFFQGRMEYGPRALGNRSILADPTDQSINDWLNKRLVRNEFMPFAPSVLDTDAADFYINYSKGMYPARFMTITFDVPLEKEKMAQAVVHIDHTARPQVVDTRANPVYYKVLKAHKELTKLPLFVNTSFNAHEEPIVCTPEDAIRSFKNGCVDALAIEDFVVEKKQRT